MNALQSVLHTRTSPRIMRAVGVTPIRVAAEIVGKEAVVTLDQLAAILGTGQHLSQHLHLQMVNMSEVQLELMARDVSIFPRSAPLDFMLNHKSTGYVINPDRSLIKKAARPQELTVPSMGYRVVLKELGEEERQSARDHANLAGLRAVGLSLPTMVTVALLSQLCLGRPLRGTYETETLLCSGQRFAVGPDERARIAFKAAYPKTYPMAIGFVRG